MNLSRMIWLVICICSVSGISAQTKKEIFTTSSQQSSVYLHLGVGIGTAKFRDFATSPLFFEGNPYSFHLSLLKTNKRNEFEVGGSFSLGNYTSIGSSNTNLFQLYYAQLFQIPLSSEAWNLKVGGVLNTTMTYRYNPSLLNNSEGYEGFAHLMAAARIEKDISLKKRFERKILFMNIRLKPRKMKLGFRTDVGIVNSNLRNGFVYTGQSALLNEYDALDDYKFKMFSGFRMGTVWDFTYFLYNKNAFQLSYIWDVWKTGSQPEEFQMAQHTIRLSILFNVNNK